MESLTVLFAAALGMGVIYFIGRKISLPAGIDGVVSAIVMSVALFFVSGALGTEFKEPASRVPDDACVTGMPTFPGIDCMTVGQWREQQRLRDPFGAVQARVTRIFGTVPFPVVLVAMLVGVVVAEEVHKRTPRTA
jgi:hypothetical protein